MEGEGRHGGDAGSGAVDGTLTFFHRSPHVILGNQPRRKSAATQRALVRNSEPQALVTDSMLTANRVTLVHQQGPPGLESAAAYIATSSAKRTHELVLAITKECRGRRQQQVLQGSATASGCLSLPSQATFGRRSRLPSAGPGPSR